MKRQGFIICGVVAGMCLPLAATLFSLKQAGYGTAPSAPVMHAVVIDSPPPKPIGPEYLTAHYTDAEFYARPANKMGIAEAPLDEGIVIRDPAILHALPGAPAQVIAAQLEEFTPETDPAPTVPIRSFYRHDWFVLGGASDPLNIDYNRPDKPSCDCKDCEPCEEVEVPEPGSIALVMAGIAGLSIWRKFHV